MNLPEGITLGSCLVGILGFMYKVSQDIAEIKKQVTNDLQHIAEEEDAKRARIYERLDSVKLDVETKFTHKEVCRVLHTQIDYKLDEIAADVKMLLKNGNAK